MSAEHEVEAKYWEKTEGGASNVSSAPFGAGLRRGRPAYAWPKKTSGAA